MNNFASIKIPAQPKLTDLQPTQTKNTSSNNNNSIHSYGARKHANQHRSANIICQLCLCVMESEAVLLVHLYDKHKVNRALAYRWLKNSRTVLQTYCNNILGNEPKRAKHASEEVAHQLNGHNKISRETQTNPNSINSDTNNQSAPAQNGEHATNSSFQRPHLPTIIPIQSTPHNNNINSAGNSKNGRTKFSEYHLEVLTDYFAYRQYLSEEELSILSWELGFDKRVLTVWFQNSRQKAKAKLRSNKQSYDALPLPNKHECQQCSATFPTYIHLTNHLRSFCQAQSKNSSNSSNNNCDSSNTSQSGAEMENQGSFKQDDTITSLKNDTNTSSQNSQLSSNNSEDSNNDEDLANNGANDAQKSSEIGDGENDDEEEDFEAEGELKIDDGQAENNNKNDLSSKSPETSEVMLVERKEQNLGQDPSNHNDTSIILNFGSSECILPAQNLLLNRSKRNNEGKRNRTKVTKEQQAELEKVFETNKFPKSGIIQELAGKTSLTLRVIQIWFQNRRAKCRRNEVDDGSVKSSEIINYLGAGKDQHERSDGEVNSSNLSVEDLVKMQKKNNQAAV